MCLTLHVSQFFSRSNLNRRAIWRRGRSLRTNDQRILGQILVEAFWGSAVEVEIQGLCGCEEGREGDGRRQEGFHLCKSGGEVLDLFEDEHEVNGIIVQVGLNFLVRGAERQAKIFGPGHVSAGDFSRDHEFNAAFESPL